MGVVSAPLGCKRCRHAQIQMAVDCGVMTLEAFPARVKFMVGMGVVQVPGVLGDLGTVVNLLESTGGVP